MDTHLSADFTEHFAQQYKQSHYNLSCLLVSVLTLLPVSQIRLLYIVILPPQSTQTISPFLEEEVMYILSQYHFRYCLAGTGVSHGWYWSFT